MMSRTGYIYIKRVVKKNTKRFKKNTVAKKLILTTNPSGK